MYKDLTEAEILYVKLLIDERYSPSFITHAIVMGREVSLHNDIRAAVDMIIKAKVEEDEE